MTTLQRERRAPAARPEVELLTRAYSMELETVADYLAASVNLDGIRAQEVARALAAGIGEELDHARRLAERLHQLGALVPAAEALRADRRPTAAGTADVTAVVRSALAGEEAAIDTYRLLIDETDGLDWVTQDLAISILADEEAHRRRFQGFLRELAAEDAR